MRGYFFNWKSRNNRSVQTLSYTPELTTEFSGYGVRSVRTPYRNGTLLSVRPYVSVRPY